MSHSVELARAATAMGSGLRIAYDVDVSQTIQPGNLVVLNNANSTVRVCNLTSTMIAAHFTNTSVAGILGVACYDVKTDANGAPVGTLVPPSTVDAGAGITYKLQNTAAGLQRDPVTGNAKLVVQICDDNTEFSIRAQTTSNAAVTVSSTKVGKLIGIQTYLTTEFASNEAATGTDLCAVVTSVNETDPNFNVSSTQCRYNFRVLPAYQQYLTGIYYAAAT